jgi:hypothetical protein
MIESHSLFLNSGIKFYIVDRQGLLGDLIHTVASFNIPPFCSAFMGESEAGMQEEGNGPCEFRNARGK